MNDRRLTNAQSGWNDEKMEASIGLLLRVGVTVSAVVIAIGGALYLFHPTGPRPGYRVFRGPSAALSHPVVILHGALAGDSRSIISLGLLLLIATPIARMVLAAIGFLLEKDWMYTGISLLVLAILLYSLIFGR